MTDDVAKWEALDAAVAAEAKRQGLERPEWVVKHLAGSLDAEASPEQVAAAVRGFRRENPWWLQVTDGGLPVVVKDEVHSNVHEGQPAREHRPDGTFAPRKPDMNELLRAALGPESDDAASE